MAWKDIISIYAALPIFLAFLVYWSFRYIGTDSQGQNVSPSRNEQWQSTKVVMQNRVLWMVAFVGGVRGMAFLALFTFLPLFLRDLGMSPFVWNLHLGLLMGVGIVSTPIVGYLSDRLGRKKVLIPGMLFLSILAFFLSSTSGGIMLILIIALLGTFLFGDQPVLTALALDVAGEGVATTVLGVLSFARFLFAAPSPIIAGAIYDSRGAGDTFLYVAALFVIGAVVLLFVPVPKTDFSAASGHHH
jgi:sugar phosphate permease